MSVRNGMAPLALAMLVVAGASACSDNSGAQAGSAKTGERNCNGALNGSAASAVQQLVRSKSFRTSSPDGGAAGAAKKIVSEYRTNGVEGGGEIGLCWIYGPKKNVSDLTISFSFSNDVPQSDKVASVFTPYHMGALALASNQRAVIYLKCSSTKFDSDGSRETFVIRGETNNRYEPDGSPAQVRRNNLIVMHSGGLALAKALACKNDADLPNDFRMPTKA
ncbi:hypothetical protein ABZ915_46490 [Streptomyces sp. NPDC046915]|uniref:hypothetical protein n=1 Tax=Streptomyces sp. NPDC046915 TaxID=3155257 RepID=UPI0033C65119